MTVEFLTQINQLEKVNNVEGAGKLKADMENILKTTTTKEQAEAELQKIKTKYVESGETDLASAIGEIQETSKQTWNKVNEWKPEKTVAKIVPSMFVKKFVREYVQKLMKDLNDYIKNHAENISKTDWVDEEKKEAMKEAEEAKKEYENLDPELKDDKLDELFEKQLIRDGVLTTKSAPPELYNPDIGNMPPSLLIATLKSYKKAIMARKKIAHE